MYNVVMLPELRDDKLALKMSSTKYGTTNIVLDKVRYSCVFIRLWGFDWHIYLLSFHAVTESLQCKTSNCCNGQSDCGCGNDSNVQHQQQSTKRIPAIKSARPRHRRALSWLRKRVKWCINTDQSEIDVVRCWCINLYNYILTIYYSQSQTTLDPTDLPSQRTNQNEMDVVRYQ